MSEPRVAEDFIHPAVESRAGISIAEANLSDRGRLAVLLQAAALLSHLETAGWRLACTWEELSLDHEGVLGGVNAEPGAASGPAQRHLLALVALLFGDQDRVVGKGQAKRLMSRTLHWWLRHQGRLPANRIVTRLLDDASFLWRSTFAAGRRSLVAELGGHRRRRLLVAGRGAFERRLLATGRDRAGLEALVVRPEAGEIWRGSSRDHERVDSGHSPGGLDLGRRLAIEGRWQEALQALAKLREPGARILQADCQRRLGRVVQARRLLRGLAEEGSLSVENALACVEVGVSICLHVGDPRGALSLISQHQIDAPEYLSKGLDLLAVEVASWVGDWQLVARRLSSTTDSPQSTSRSWRWLIVRSGWARARGDLEEAERLAGQALGGARRLLGRQDAAEIWLRLATLRLERDHLARAERAARHALRILESVEGRTVVAAAGLLAEIRVRRGRLQGVRRLLRSGALNVDGAPSEGGSEPVELVSRLDLVRGQPGPALQRLETIQKSQRAMDPEGLDGVRILMARALGWLGRASEARDLLAEASASPKRHLESEEIPALWALAGDWARARETAADDSVGRLWRGILTGDSVDPGAWDALGRLATFRAARMVFDIQILAPGKVPDRWMERAVGGLREVGAHSFAERLDRIKEGSWRAVQAFLEGSARRGRDIGDLFTTAGYFDVRLEWRQRGIAQVLIPGRRGDRELQAEGPGGRLVLATDSMDPVIRALFALAAREFEPEGGQEVGSSTRVRGMLGESEALRRSLHRLDRLAGSDIPVLIEGETGTGKELAARQLHELSCRSGGILVTVNCAALSDTLLLSDLFGHVRGAFTGADRDRAGVFESALGGTVLLDEIGDLPLAAQGKLLRVLQEGEVRRVGESLPRRIDVRVVAATHRNLRSMVDEKSFRADLFYRLSVGRLNLPALRHRERDVLLIADRILQDSGHILTPRARQRLLAHSWPGNIRELRNVLQVAMALSDGMTIDAVDLELPEEDSQIMVGYHRQVEEFRRDLVREALAASNGRRSVAAKRLEVSRQAMSYLVRRFGLQ